jgi:GntR family transcriptional repressor for pyruvate dehydrogenase complex
MAGEPNGIVLRPPRKVTIVESIVDQMVQQIHQGTLKPGDRLPSERQLIDMLGVSRSSVREALQGLMVMGLVESHPGQGSFVTSRRAMPNANSLHLSDELQREMRLQFIDARRTIECPIVRLAAERAQTEELARLRADFEAYKRDPFGHASSSRFSSPHYAMHVHLAEMSGNPFFVSVVEQLLHAVPQALHAREELSLDDSSIQRMITDEVAMHEAIVRAVESHDGEAAYRAMDYHLDYERRLVLEMFAHDAEQVEAAP